MTDDRQPLRRLADRVEQRIAELALEYAEVARLAGFSIEVLRKIRNGVGVRASTYRKLERALAWQQDSVAAILAGSDPSPMGNRDSNQPSAEGGEPRKVSPTLEQELELAARLMAAQIRELGLSPDEAEEAWERARARIVDTHKAAPTGEREDDMEGPRGRRSVG